MKRKREKKPMDAIDIGLIIIGILGTIMLLIGIFVSVAVIITAPIFGKLIGVFFAIAMVAFIIGLWMLILI